MNVARFTALLLCLVLGVPALAASAGTPHLLIKLTRQQMIAVGEGGGRLADFREAQEKAARAMRELVAKGPPGQLVERDRKGRSPLMEAAYMGYPALVEALLTSDAVRAGIDAADNQGLSAWILANLPFQQAQWVCRPAFRERPDLLAPLMAVQGYYLLSARNPFREARRLLEEAGAETDMAKVRETWQRACKPQEPHMQAKIAASEDVLETVLEENLHVFARILAESLVGSRGGRPGR